MEGGHRLREALDPRVRIQRDRWNEYFVFLLSATGASILAPLILFVAGAFTEVFSIGIYLAASLAIELVLIFGIGRPAMKPAERAGWAVLWGGAALAFGAAFYYLVFEQVL